MLLGGKIHCSWFLDKVLPRLPAGHMRRLSEGTIIIFSVLYNSSFVKATHKYKAIYKE